MNYSEFDVFVSCRPSLLLFSDIVIKASLTPEATERFRFVFLSLLF